MKILFCGDIIGKAGRRAIASYLKPFVDEKGVDIVIANGENATNGIGLSKDHAIEILDCGVDIITLGNHAFKKDSIFDLMHRQSIPIIRPINMKNVPGVGYKVFTKGDCRIGVINIIGSTFMNNSDSIVSPFDADIFNSLKEIKSQGVNGIIVDFHGEASSEKVAMGYFLDGHVSAILGTHTHIPTADSRILPKGSFLRSDVGMCGDYNSIIGFDVPSVMPSFIPNSKFSKFAPATKHSSISGNLIELDINGKVLGFQDVFLGDPLSF